MVLIVKKKTTQSSDSFPKVWDPASGNNQNSRKGPPAHAREALGPWDALVHRGTSGTPG